jgi:hypothetical protein
MSFVVYRHIRLDTEEVFYIGIGNEKRPYDKKGRNEIWNRVVDKAGYRVEIIHSGLTWEECIEKEIVLIKFYGRKDKGEGPLVNLTDGGEGNVGFIYPEESKAKISQTLKEYFKENENPFKGKSHSPETKERLSQLASERPVNYDAIQAMAEHNRGRTYDEEHRKKLSEAAKNRPPMPQEVRDKISKTVSIVQTGRQHSEETKQKISQTLMGHAPTRTGPMSEEHRQKISQAQKGRKLTPEHRAKLSIAAKNRKRKCKI